jgi:hypothetical protein
LTLNSVSSDYDIRNWNDFISEFEDSDNDGEKDNFRSLDPGDGPLFTDEIVSFIDYDELNISEIILKSNQNIPLFFGNTIGHKFKVGDIILIYTYVGSDYEDDGDPCEKYEVTKIAKFDNVEDDTDNEVPESTVSTPLEGWLLICLVPLIPLLIVIYFLVLRPYLNRKNTKSEMNTSPQINTPPQIPQNQNQIQICPSCYQNTEFIPQNQKWYCRNCEKYQ